MSVLDGALGRPGVLELSAHRRILPFSPSIGRSNSFCCYAKISVDDDEHKHEIARKGFSIRVPTMPKLGDIESARRMLESAFQALSFEMPKLPIESALQGLTFDIFKLSIPKRGFVSGITGFVATRLKKPPKDVQDAAVLDEAFYPRCAWPRTLKEAHVEEVFSIGTSENSQDLESGVNLVLKESTSAYPQQHTTHRSPKADLRNRAELGERPSIPSSIPSSLTGKASFKAPVGPHCAWPRKTHQFVNANGPSSVSRYPRSAWPRNSLSSNGVVLGGQESLVEFNMGSAARKEQASPCITEGGPRCAWPRKTLSAMRSCHAAETTATLAEDLCADGERGKDADDGEIASTDFDGAAELPRRTLATSVGLSVMNHLVKGSIVTSLFDFCSLLPAGYLEIAEEEDAALDVGRRTLLVFIKNSSA